MTSPIPIPHSEFGKTPPYSERPAPPPYFGSPDDLPKPPAEPPHYTFSSGNLQLDLGPKIWGTPLPTYGKNDPVEGSLTISKPLKNVMQIEIKLEARLTSIVTERGLPAGHTQLTLFTVSKSLLQGISDLERGTNLPFELLMPETIEVEGLPHTLPPTSKWYQIGTSAEVTYQVIVDVTRKGLGRHEKVVTDILYLPRSRSTKSLPMSFGLSPSDAKRPSIDMTNWVTIPLKPTLPKGSETMTSPFSAELGLPMCFLAGCPPLSFHIEIKLEPSTSLTVGDLSSLSVTVQLVRVVTLTVNDRKSTSESVVGTPMIFTERGSMTSREVYGKIGWGTEGQECSWEVGKVLQVLHVAKVEIRPPAGEEKNMPSFIHRQRVWMHTDDPASDAPEREGPALGLLQNSLLRR